MDDLKGKVKGFMKKANNSLASSSSGRFKGQGRVLGSSSGSANTAYVRSPISVSSGSNSNPASSCSKPASVTTSNTAGPLSSTSANKNINDPNCSQGISNIPNSNSNLSENHEISSPKRAETNEFDPFGSLITTGKRNRNGYSLNVVECPVCNLGFASEEEVSVHIESCVTNSGDNVDDGTVEDQVELVDKSAACVSAYLTGKPAEGSVDIILRLLKNIVREPENAKFRRIRMSNPKIREAVGEAAGGIELLECAGFEIQEEGGEMWAVMDVPLEANLLMLKKLISVLEPKKSEKLLASAPSAADFNEKIEKEDFNQTSNEHIEHKVIDRQIRVFFSVTESVATKIEVPESFYNLSIEEVKREAQARKKKLAESQLLIPKSYKEKQAKATRRRYKETVIRVQFPDGVVLQAVFAPQEPTSILYEVS